MPDPIDNEELKFTIYLELGECYTQVGEIDKAIDHFQEAIQLNPRSDRTYVGLGVAYLQQGHQTKAKENFLRAIELKPENDKALCGLGMVFNAGPINSQREGLRYFQQALNLNPENMPALMGLMQAAHALEELPLAEEYLKKYLELHVVDRKMLYCLAGVSFKMGKLTEAEDALERILLFEPENQDAQELKKQVDLALEKCRR